MLKETAQITNPNAVQHIEAKNRTASMRLHAETGRVTVVFHGADHQAPAHTPVPPIAEPVTREDAHFGAVVVLESIYARYGVPAEDIQNQVTQLLDQRSRRDTSGAISAAANYLGAVAPYEVRVLKKLGGIAQGNK